MLVVVRLSGGLGNQLFQYAAGRALSVKHNVPLYIDKAFYLNSPNRIFMLNSFNVVESVVGAKKLVPLLLNRKFKLFDYFKSTKSIFLESKFLYREKSFSFDSDFVNIKTPVVLDGYWQSEKYFIDCLSVIKNDFIVRSELTVTQRRFIENTAIENSVAIHVRCGDYISNSQINSIHGVCHDEYYVDAYSKLVSMVGEVVPYFFTDDVNAARRIIKLIGKGVLVSDVCAGNDVSDFVLMK